MRRSLILLATAGLAFGVPTSSAQLTYSFFEIAGSSDQGTRDGQGPEAQFTSAAAIARDGAGNLYVADTGAFTVRKITPTGLVSTLAGSPGQGGSVDGAGSAARFVGPRGIAVDASNNVYVTDAVSIPSNTFYHIRRITPAGDVTTVGTSQSFWWTTSLEIAIDDRDGTMYVANRGYHIVERFTPGGSVSAFAGLSGSSGSADGQGGDARFDSPTGIAVDALGRVYVSDTNNHTIRRITPEGLVSTWLGVAGDRGPAEFWPASATDTSLYFEFYDGEDGPAAAARFNLPGSLSLDRATGRLLSVGFTTTRLLCCSSLPSSARVGLRAIAPDGTVTTIRGSFPDSGPFLDGVVWAGENALVTAMNMVFSVGTGGALTEFAGRGEGCTTRYSLDGSRYAARFCNITSLTLDAAGGIYVADAGNYTVRRVAPGGAVTTVAGAVGQYGSTDGAPATARFGNSSSYFLYPNGMGLAWNGFGTFVADTANSTLRAIRDGSVSRVAGQPGQTGTTGGRGADARFNLLHDVASNSHDHLLIADTANHSIRSMSNPFAPTGFAFVGTLAGLPGTPGSADGTGTEARFSGPHGIAIGPGDVAYIADAGNHTIRRMTPEGMVTTLAGLAGQAGTVDGNGANARFNMPTTIAVDRDGNVFVGELSGLRRITPTGDVTTIPNAPGMVEAVDAAGTLYLRSGGRIFVGTTAGSSPEAPAITTPPANLTVGSGSAVPGTMSVVASGVPAPAYQWEVSYDGGSRWDQVTDRAGVTGSVSATLTFTGMAVTQGALYRAIATNAFGSVTSGPATLTVLGTAPATMTFGVERAAPNRVTPPQQVSPRNGSGASAWTASADAAWLVADGSTTNGSQTGVFTITVNPAAFDVSTAPSTLTATVTLVATNIGVSVTLPVTLRVHDPGPLTIVGQVDTPVQDAIGVQGAIGVTGWALHPVGVDRVEVYRACVVGMETCAAVSEPALSGAPVVYIGPAVFVAGARPDIEGGSFASYPATRAAGWGMQVLTTMLPRTTGTFASSGGQGPIALYVLAYSVTGEQALLGRNWSFGAPAPTTISLDNDVIAKPFGTIDTPASAQTVSGTFANYGWALTPDSDTVADSTDILIPTDGSSMVVFIDGVATAQVAYNQCRDGVGNPVPAGAFCGDDISNIFGNTTPQEALGDRFSNPTRFRNLDASRGAIGAYNIDTTTLSNGLHTIAWSVTDSAGRVEGIGSRYFTVLNGSSDAVSAEFGVLNAQRAESRRSLAPRHGSGQPEPLSKVGEGGDFQIVGRTGFDLRRPWTPLHADVNGIRHVRIPIDNGRVELSLGAGIEAAYLDANGERRPLPPGSAFDPATGIFTWAPGPGYLGTYRFVFSGPGVLESWGPGVLGAPSADFSAITVDVTLRAETKAAAGESEVRMHLDAARLRQPSTTAQVAPSSVEGQGSGGATTLIDVVGWALDPQAEIGSGIGAVHIWARRLGPGVLGSWGPEVQGGASPVFLGAAELDVARPDVAAAFGAPFGHAGFRLESATALPPGEYEITAYVWNWRTARWEDARSARVTVR